MTDWAKRLYPLLPVPWLGKRLIGGDCAVILDAPLILYVFDWTLWSDDGALLPVFRRYRHVHVYLLVAFSWHHEEARHIARIPSLHARHQRRHPNHRVIYMANTETLRQALTEAGLRAVFMSHNALVDPNIYRPLDTDTRRFSAVYDARISPFKRHHLASQIQSLALLAARSPRHHDEAYARVVAERLPHAHWYNDPLARDYRSFQPAEVNQCLNECGVGLCLSAEEGAMFASIQYLLAGLPVVSTESRGGRDVFFDPDYTCVVKDDPRSVREGVESMLQCPKPAGEIRARTMEKMASHLDRLFGLLDEIQLAEGRNLDLRPTLWQSGVGGGPSRVAPAAIFERIRQCARNTESPSPFDESEPMSGNAVRK